MLPVVVISNRARKRLKGKHPWIFSNEIKTQPAAQPGDLVNVQDQAGNSLALGYYNPHTLIAVRILSNHQSFELTDRIRTALEYRTQLYPTSIYRLIFGESDGLPGLIVDRYEETLVAQILTAGMEKMHEEILNALIQIVQPSRILLRNDSEYRKLEGLPLESSWIFGEPLEKQILEIDGLKFWIDFQGGQKTGFFLDQRENRRRLAAYAHGEKMLDAFCYSGAWALYGARAGMTQITAVDASEEALRAAQSNAELNNRRITTIVEDVFEFLRKHYAAGERYDLIVLDPPAFCKSKRHLNKALKGYREINLRAMKLLNRGGVLFSCSCSQPVTTEIFLEMLRRAAADSGRLFQLKELLFQPLDHPVLLNFPESHYLKGAVLQVS